MLIFFKRLSLNDYASTAFILLSLTVLFYSTSILSRVDNLLFDIGQKLYYSPPPDDIIIVAIDEMSLSKLGRWPWSRSHHAHLIDRLKKEGALVIGLNIVFAEPDLLDLNADKELAHSILLANNVVLPVLLENVRANGQLVEKLPVAIFANNVVDLGRAHAPLDEDGVARSIFRYEGIGLPTWQLFSQAVLNVAQKKSSQNKLNLPFDKTRLFSLEQQNQQKINFLGPAGHFPRISYIQVLNGEFAQDTFKNKMVLVGATASGMNDVLPTPVSGQGQPMAGVEFHANVLEAIRNNQLVTIAPPWLSIVIVLAITLLPLAWLPKSSAFIGLISTLLFFIIVALLAAASPKMFGFWLAPSAALLPILIAYPVWSWRKLESAQRYLTQELDYLNNVLQMPLVANNTHRYDHFDNRIQQVRTASNQLRLLQDDKKEMLAFISHDLRAPLARALMLLDDYQTIANKLRPPLAQALELAEEFLQNSRAEMTNSTEFKELDLASLAHQSIDDAYESAKYKNIELVREIAEASIWVNGNFSLIHRAILNLVLNAIKFSPEHSSVQIKLKLYPVKANELSMPYKNDKNEDYTHGVLSVVNTGPGISPDQQEQLFKRFSRVKAEHASTNGAGLGLYFVHTVMQKHLGSVSVESELNRQTAFNITLPIVGYEMHINTGEV